MARIYDNAAPDGRIEPTITEAQDMTDLPAMNPTKRRTCGTCGKTKPADMFPKTGRNARKCADCRKVREAKQHAGRKAAQNPNSRIKVVSGDTFKPKEKKEETDDGMPALARVVADAVRAGLKVEVTIHG